MDKAFVWLLTSVAMLAAIIVNVPEMISFMKCGKGAYFRMSTKINHKNHSIDFRDPFLARLILTLILTSILGQQNKPTYIHLKY